MKLAWIFAFLPFTLGLHEVSDETCMSLVPTFTSIVNGSDLTVCSQNELQCCSQSDEDALGRTLSRTAPLFLGIELESLRDSIRDNLYPSLNSLRLSLIGDVLRPLMNSSADVTFTTAQMFTDDLQRISEEILYNIDATIQGTMNLDLTEEISRYFSAGLSVYYYNVTLGSSGFEISPADRTCALNVTQSLLFPAVEQAKIASLGNNLQQIAVAYEVARALNTSLYTILSAISDFDVTYTCTNVWTQQYACPLCAGQATPLCEGLCIDVLIGCSSSLQQVIVQLNVLIDFIRASVNSLIGGNPYDYINLNNIAGDYIDIFSTSLAYEDDLESAAAEACDLGKRKRSIDTPIMRHKRQDAVNFTTVTISQSIINDLANVVLHDVMNVSLDSGRIEICRDLMANGSHTNCTVAVSNVTSYMSTFNDLEISDQINNPSGDFNLTQLRQQAKPLPYVATELLMDSDIMMLYGNVLPGRAIPNLSFLNDTTVNPMEPNDTQPTMPPGGDGGDGATAISCSLFIMLAALLFASVL